jgi:hypothetical protein
MLLIRSAFRALPNMTAIFISHSSKDKAPALALEKRLQERGHAVFLDFDPDAGIRAGSDWEQTLYRRLRQCRVVIPLLTPHWLRSKWCFAEVVQARSAGKTLIPLKIAECDSSGVLVDIQQIDLTRDPQEGWRRLDTALREVFPWDPARPPYPGLLPFQADDAAIFFGRGPEIEATVEMLEGLRLRRGRFGPRCALLLGASGSGKSSLARAGILPRLQIRDDWLPMPPFRPREDPIGELAGGLARAYEQAHRPRDYAEVRELLTESLAGSRPDGAVLLAMTRDLALKSGRPDATVLLTLDQAEELFAAGVAEDASDCLDLLRAALERSGGRLMLLATLRSELLGAFQTHPFLVDARYPEPFAYAQITVDPVPLDRSARWYAVRPSWPGSALTTPWWSA